jgi:uncharacterized protein (TIGR02598 family)
MKLSPERLRAKPLLHRARSEFAFSLIEVTIALAISSVAVIALLGMFPAAMMAGRDAVDQTAIGTILEDVHERLEGSELTVGTVPGSPFFYDEQGRFWSQDQERPDNFTEEHFFRVDVRLAEPATTSGSSTPVELPESLLAATVEVSWPLDTDGNAIGRANPKASVTYMVTTLTGPDWKSIDPDYRAKVEY